MNITRRSIAVLLSFCISFTSIHSQNQTGILLGDSLFEKSDWKKAIKAYEDALQIDNLNGTVWYRLGQAYENEKMYEQAIDAYKKGLEFKSALIPPVFMRTRLAKTYAISGDSTKSLDLLTDMVNNGGYGNYPDLDSSPEFKWMRSNPRFSGIVAKATTNAYPCISNPQNREFDFWVGEWNVFRRGTNYQVGKEKVEKASGGCLVIENWTAIGYPNEGKSMNFISPKTSKWEQVWMGSGGQYLNYYNGQYSDGAMRYEGDGLDKAGKKILFHLTYFNEGPNNLRQLLEQSLDEGKTWNTLYDFEYERKK